MRPGPLLLISVGAALGGCNPPLEPVQFKQAPSAPTHAWSTRAPQRLQGLVALPPDGGEGGGLVVCGTCHARRKDQPMVDAAQKLERFHRGFIFEHGGTPCNGCHAPDRGDLLHLANGEAVALSDALRLCAQCHGPQYRDYQHGAHGGGVGYWDLSRGPREKNHCVDCHDPHVPRFQGGLPAPGPRTRGVEGAHHD